MIIDLHRFLSIEIHDPPLDVQMSLSERFPTLTRASSQDDVPSVTVRFVKEITSKSSLRYISPLYATDGSKFYILRAGKGLIRFEPSILDTGGVVEIPTLDELEKPLALDYLNRIVWLLAWFWSDKQNGSMMHAACASLNRNGIVLTGWGGVGKTSLVLRLVQRGFSLLSNDWTMIQDGRAFSYPYPFMLTRGNLSEFNGIANNMGDRLAEFRLVTLGRSFVSTVVNLTKKVPYGALHNFAIRAAKLGDFLDEVPIEAPVHQLLPGVHIEGEASISALFLLQPMSRGPVQLTPVSSQFVISRVCPCHELEFEQFVGGMVHGLSAAFPERHIWERTRSLWEHNRQSMQSSLSRIQPYLLEYPRQIVKSSELCDLVLRKSGLTGAS